MHPHPPPYPGQPGQQHPADPQYPPIPGYPQYPPAQYPPAQYPPAQYPPAQSYPPYPAGAQQQYPGHPAPAHPGYAYPPAPYPPSPKRTEFGWASIVVGSIALVTSLLPYGGFFTVLAALVLVLAGFLGKHERSRIPAAVGAAITGLALVASVVVTLFWRDIYGGFLGF